MLRIIINYIVNFGFFFEFVIIVLCFVNMEIVIIIICIYDICVYFFFFICKIYVYYFILCFKKVIKWGYIFFCNFNNNFMKMGLIIFKSFIVYLDD